jgi:hypothetical protein
VRQKSLIRWQPTPKPIEKTALIGTETPPTGSTWGVLQVDLDVFIYTEGAV